MKAAVLHGDYDLRYEEFPEPELQPGSVKIKVCACGVCGSDIPRITAHGAHYYPIVLGHEFSGYITEVAKDVTTHQVGEHVVVAPLIPCLKCPDCMKGQHSLCKHYSFIGSRVQGGYADYIVVPALNAVKIDSSVPYELGALFEPATVSLHGLRHSGFIGGKTVAILGGGTIGLFALQWAKIFGASTTVVFGRDKEHLLVAKRLGADAIISTMDEDYLEQAKTIAPNGFDFVYETAGSTETIKLSFTLAANRAHVCLIGTPTKEMTFTPREWELLNRKEFFLTGSWMSGNAPYPGDEWTLTAECFANGKLKYDDGLFFKKIPLSRPQELIDTLRNGKLKGRILLTNLDKVNEA